MQSNQQLVNLLIEKQQDINHLPQRGDGGKERAMKGPLWETLLLKVTENIIERKKLSYTAFKPANWGKSNKRIFGHQNNGRFGYINPKTNFLLRRNPDLTVWDKNNQLIVIGSAKDYGDKTMLCPELETFQIATRAYSNVKCIYFCGQIGVEIEEIQGLTDFHNLNNVFVHYFIPEKRNSLNKSIILDKTEEELNRHVENFTDFMYRVIN